MEMDNKLNGTKIEHVFFDELVAGDASITTKLTQSQINRIRAMYNIGYTTSDIADSMGISASTVRDYAK